MRLGLTLRLELGTSALKDRHSVRIRVRVRVRVSTSLVSSNGTNPMLFLLLEDVVEALPPPLESPPPLEIKTHIQWCNFPNIRASILKNDGPYNPLGIGPCIPFKGSV